MLKRFTKKDILTIPNFLSFFRFLLIPVFVWLYCVDKNFIAAVIVVALSAVTDVADGRIARSFNMVSDFGKIIDPIADKLTQAALIIILISRHRWMTALILLLLVKEGFMLLAGYLAFKVTDKVNGAKWYGKASTVVLYAVMMTLILFPEIPEAAADALIVLCGAAMLLSLVMYGRYYIEILKHENIGNKHKNALLKAWKIVLLLIWAVIILIFIFHQKDISVGGILRFTPADPVLAAIVMLALYALKSLSVIIFIGLLYIADGIVFSLPSAIAINIIGIAVAVTIPYFIGKKIGKDAVNGIVAKYPKAEAVRRFRSGNDFFFSFIIRIAGIFPSDIISLYMGAVDMKYPQYLLGCLAGMIPQMIAFTVMGTSITDIHSPAFIISVCAEAFIVLCSAAVFMLYKRKQAKNRSGQ